MPFEKIETSGLIVLFVGLILLAFTFFSAYQFLSGSLSILASADLNELFGRALAPLIEAIIRILYLAIMGWIGSLVTIRAVQLLKRDRETVPIQLQVKQESTKQLTVPQTSKNESKTEARNPEKTAVPEPPADPEKETPANKAPEKPIESVA